MHTVILGAGALGTVLGAHLTRAGEDVTLLARGQRAAYLQEHGATITGLVDFTAPVRVVTDPSHIHDADVLIVTVKTYDMASALPSVKHLHAASVLSLQNGVLKNEQLAQTFGWDKVVGAMTHFSVDVLPTGTVHFRTNQGVYLGALPEGTSPRVQTFAKKTIAEQLDGRYVLKTDRQELSAEELWRPSVLRTRVVAACRAMKSPWMERPIFPHRQRRTETHMFLCIFAYHLLVAIEKKFLDQGTHPSWWSLRQQLSPHQIVTVVLPTGNGQTVQIRTGTTPEPTHRAISATLGIPREVMKPKIWHEHIT